MMTEIVISNTTGFIYKLLVALVSALLWAVGVDYKQVILRIDISAKGYKIIEG